MVYQGSKNRLAKDIVPIIQKYIDDNNCDTYIELFVGGANIIDKIKCNNKIGYDINDDLICLLNYAKDNPDLQIAPDRCTFEHYSEVRSDRSHEKYPQEYRALIGYMASYGGRYFDGGYARGKRGIESSNNIKYTNNLNNIKKQAPNLKDIKFYCADYKDINIEDYYNCVFYLDPPYKSTKQYSKQKINYDEFYEFCRKLSEQNIVIVSEYNMPKDFKCIWSKQRNVQQKSDRTNADSAIEKLYIIQN